MPSSYYEIRVTSVLPPEVLLDFDRLIASVEPVETVVHGPLRDQADLNGLLARLETFGVQVLEIRRLKDRDPPAAERPLSGVPERALVLGRERAGGDGARGSVAGWSG